LDDHAAADGDLALVVAGDDVLIFIKALRCRTAVYEIITMENAMSAATVIAAGTIAAPMAGHAEWGWLPLS
jgi:hypothetical protein